ncbi:MAG: TOMM precursor leader peptide-binding protein [Anaerolineae bacterium]|nr:TOMM precursor leader peptide-binding protein [Anaerolineae bacterium]
MISKPRFRPSLVVEVVEPKHVFLLSERRYSVLEGEVYPLLVPLLDGQHTLEDILAELGSRVPFQKVIYALHVLEHKGHLVEAGDTLPPAIATFWDYLDVEQAAAARQLEDARVAVRAVGDVDAGPLVAALQAVGIQPGGDETFEVIVTDDYLRDELAAINKRALAAGRPWMLVKPVGAVIWLGPIFRPGQTGCWACLAQRLRANRQVESYIIDRTDTGWPLAVSRVAVPTTVQVGINLAATEIARWVVQAENKRLDGRIVTLDLLSLETQEHVLVRRPQCPICGEGQSRTPTEPAPIVLQSHAKRYTADGGHWSVTPQETFDRNQHHISPITGIVSWFTSVEETHDGLTHNYTTGHHFPVMLDRVRDLHANMRFRSGGKGATEIQAKVSALGEAVERYSGVYWGDEYCVRASYKDLQPEAIHPNACMLFSESQYQHRDRWAPQRTDDFHYVPQVFDEAMEIDWTPVWSLTDQRFRYLPTTYCYYGHPDLRRRFAASDSNGNAAGNTLEEAILQGFTELAERDGVAIWWYNRIRRPAVNIASFDVPYVEELKAYYQQLGRELWALDLTNDLGVPTFAVVSRQLDRAVEDIIIGFSAHLDPRIALLRAATEANQYLPAFVEALPDGRTRYWWDRQDAIDWWQTATLDNQPYLVPAADQPPKTLSDYPALAGDDLRDDVLTCVDITRQCGLEMLVLDQTRPDIGLNVAKVIVPGLRHFWRRLAPGRLYDVPVELGWLQQPRGEDELNPVSVFV